MIGKTISHYKIVEKIGAGGMGVVYKAEDTKLDRVVALKFLPPEFSRDKEAKKRFLQEARTAAAIEHSNICPIYEVNEDDGQLFITMSYLKGQTLKDRIEKGPLSINETLDIVIQVAEGLHKAHKKEIIHRDIKSANIMITDEGIVKILDFGLAKLRGHTKLTKESTTLGTVSYMSPEQTIGETVDQRSDIWSLGVVFYEMLTAQMPFRGHYEQAIIYSIMNEEPQPLKELIPDIPEQISQIINKLLAKDPSQRYPDLGAFLEDLKRIKKGKELKDISPKPRFRIIPTTKSLVVGVILIAAIVAAFFIFKGKSTPEIPPVEPGKMPSLAVVHFENKSGDEKLDNWRDAFSQLLTSDLSQSRYIKVLRSDEVYGIFKALNLLEAKRYSTQDLKDVARNGKVNHVLKGSYIKAGENFVITAMLINASSGETISSLSVRAEGEKDIFPKVDELTREIKSKLELTADQIAGDVDKEVGEIITSSPEAFEHFMRAGRYWNSGEYRKQIDLLEQALKIDPEFAWAYFNMAFAYARLGYLAKYGEYIKKALELSHRLPDRERYLIEAEFYQRSEKTLDKAIEAYQKIIRLYPFNLVANVKLGIIYESQEEWDKVISRFEAAARSEEPTFIPHLGIAITYQSKGLYGKAREKMEYCLNQFPDNWQIRVSLAGNYCIQNKFDRAMIEVEKAISLAPKRWEPQAWKASVLFYQGYFREAETSFRTILESQEKFVQISMLFWFAVIDRTLGQFEKAQTHLKQAMNEAQKKGWQYWNGIAANELGYNFFARGKFEECLHEFNGILAKPPVFARLNKQALYFKAMVYLELKSFDKAQKTEVELLEYLNKGRNKKRMRWLYLLLGQKELKKKNLTGAVDYFNQALSMLSNERGDQLVDHSFTYHALYYDASARAYLESGNLQKARNLFQKITTLTFGRVHCGDIYTKAFYQLGKIYQQQGKKDNAIKNYNQFIELWKNCDPIFQPMVRDAKDQVKKLEFTPR